MLWTAEQFEKLNIVSQWASTPVTPAPHRWTLDQL